MNIVPGLESSWSNVTHCVMHILYYFGYLLSSIDRDMIDFLLQKKINVRKNIKIMLTKITVLFKFQCSNKNIISFYVCPYPLF